ncbi:KOW domain-containing protein [Plasmodiophora brassicae]
MGKFIKSKKVVIVLSGRYAGRKAVVVKTFDDGHAKRKFGHALVVGIDKYPLKVTKAMSKNKVLKRSKVKPFIKYINYQHIMPTRYSVDMDVSTLASTASMENADTRKEARKAVKAKLEERYLKGSKPQSGMNWFFKKLRF